LVLSQVLQNTTYFAVYKEVVLKLKFPNNSIKVKNSMDPGFVDVLKKLIAEQGREAFLNPSKCKALLADYAKGEYKKETRLFVAALEAGVQKAIDATKELGICKQQQVRVLQDEHFLAAEAAAEIVDTLALVLRGEAAQSVVCANCGKELQKEWKICPYCSTPVLTKGASNSGQTAASNTSQAIKPENAAAEAAVQRGEAYIKNADFVNAIKEYTEAIRLDPNNADLYVCRGAAYGKKQQWDAAFKDCTEAIRLDPNKSSAYYIRAHLYTEKQQWDAAINDYTELIRLDPNDSIGYSGRAHLYIEKQQWDAAINDYTELIRLDPNDSYAYSGRGVAYSKNRQYDAAINDYTEAIRLKPNDAISYINRGDVYIYKQQWDEAIKDFTESIRLNPNNSYAYSGRGFAYVETRTQQFQKVLNDYEEAIRLDPNNHTARAFFKLLHNQG
jgi:tetratricopeptide (TPR) repeat protein